MWPSVRDSSMVSSGVSGVSMSRAERMRESLRLQYSLATFASINIRQDYIDAECRYVQNYCVLLVAFL